MVMNRSATVTASTYIPVQLGLCAMAERGTKKRRSVEQEDFLAASYPGGRRSTTSGAHDDNDVISTYSYHEAKYEGAPGEKEATGYRVKLSEMEKIVDAARKVGKDAAFQVRLYAPESTLADRDGNVDLVVRLMADDCVREHMLNDWEGD